MNDSSTDPEYQQQLKIYAERWVAEGYTVIPLAQVHLDSRGEKVVKPLIRWGSDNPIDTPEGVMQWFGPGRQARGIAIDCGRSKIFALDLDDYKHGDIPFTIPDGALLQSSARGGRHVLTGNPDALRNTAGRAQGVDSRGAGGLLLVAPTRVTGAGEYLVVGGLAAIRGADKLPPVPVDVVRALAVRSSSTALPPGTPTPVDPARADTLVQAARAEFMATGHGEGRYAALLSYLGVAARFGLAKGLDHHQVFETLHDDVARHPGYFEPEWNQELSEKAIADIVHAATVEPWVFEVAEPIENLIDPDWLQEAASDPTAPGGEHAIAAGLAQPTDADLHPHVRKALQELRVRAEAQRVYTAERHPFMAARADRGFITGTQGMAELRATRRRYLVSGVIAEGSYGALGAEAKTGKTWLAVDLAVALATGTPWLGRYETAGPCRVAFMANEGGRLEVFDRIRAVCEFYGLDVDVAAANIMVQDRATVVTDPEDMNALYAGLVDFDPALLLIDSFYLAAGDADGTNLAAMGRALNNVQGLAQELDAALLLTVHWNKTGQGNGVERWSGTGLQEWARFRINVAGDTTNAGDDDLTGRTTAELEVRFDGAVSGGAKLTRTVWRDDRNDLDAQLRYTLTHDVLRPDRQVMDERAAGKVLAVRQAVLRFIADAADAPTATAVKNAVLGVGSKTDKRGMLDQLIGDECVEVVGQTDALTGARAKEGGADTFGVTPKGMGELMGGGPAAPSLDDLLGSPK